MPSETNKRFKSLRVFPMPLKVLGICIGFANIGG
jgi:hypothetical protein